ncbi:pyrophosphatase [Rhizobium mongolense]|uniref:pyrophosphatase n=1 Tax=Rhizobium mongolense TaxID=57676 RepID=UPI0034A35868
MLADLAEKFESSSRRYAEVNGIERDPDWYLLKLQEERANSRRPWNRVSGRGRPKGKAPDELKQDLADETADMLGHILLFARQNGIDLALAIERKWLFRP